MCFKKRKERKRKEAEERLTNILNNLKKNRAYKYEEYNPMDYVYGKIESDKKDKRQEAIVAKKAKRNQLILTWIAILLPILATVGVAVVQMFCK